MSKYEGNMTMDVWTENETKELLKAAVFDEDCWGYLQTLWDGDTFYRA